MSSDKTRNHDRKWGLIETILGAIIAGCFGLGVAYISKPNEPSIQEAVEMPRKTQQSKELPAPSTSHITPTKELKRVSDSSSSTSSTGRGLDFSNPDTWQVVGYWDYDPIDAQQLANGFVLRSQPGAGLGVPWKGHLEMKNHSVLRSRQRTLWPVKINLSSRRVWVHYPGYPTYQGHIDMPGEQYDGTYLFSDQSGETDS